jgi:cyclic pyranopterin phosphate synthase
MNDSCEREINYLRVSVTDRCNLRCIYCMPKKGLSLIGHDDILRYEEIIRVIRVSLRLGLVKVRVTGGEPLVRRGIVDFLSALRSVTGLKDVSLTTNGILLKSMAGNIFSAGISRINVSLDSLNHAKYKEITRGGSLEDVLSGIEEAHRVGFSPIKINVVTIRGFNEDEVLNFARMTIEKPYQVRFIELMPIGRAGENHENSYVSTDEIVSRIGQVFTMTPLEDRMNKLDGPARLFRLKDAQGEVGFISSISRHFCESCNRLRLTAEGRLRACLFSDHEIDLKTAVRRGCTDDEILALFNRAIEAKPKGLSGMEGESHIKKCAKGMSTIGG